MNAPFRRPIAAAPFPAVDFLHPDPLGDDALFIEPELYRRTFDASGLPRTWRIGTGAANWLDICRHVVGDADVGIIEPPGDPNGGFVILRRRDWESVQHEGAR